MIITKKKGQLLKIKISNPRVLSYKFYIFYRVCIVSRILNEDNLFSPASRISSDYNSQILCRRNKRIYPIVYLIAPQFRSQTIRLPFTVRPSHAAKRLIAIFDRLRFCFPKNSMHTHTPICLPYRRGVKVHQV